ncbi:MAG: hypothetical protein ACJ8FK_18090, partial [Xanthobacteraceae bacterium]
MAAAAEAFGHARDPPADPRAQATGEGNRTGFEAEDAWGTTIVNLDYKAVDAAQLSAMAVENLLVENIMNQMHVRPASTSAEDLERNGDHRQDAGEDDDEQDGGISNPPIPMRLDVGAV